jgi:CDP-diacylglycerol--serine O-phosphatidyltransferase
MKRRRFRDLLENNRWLKAVPTLLTLGNSLCGFAAVLFTLQAYDHPRDVTPQVLALSAWIILGAMLFDMLDGFAARLFNAASMHGMQMDSLADMVTFGLAPAVVVAVMAHRIRELHSMQYYLVWGLCAVYLGCAALRLATYNVHAILEKKSSDKFTGLPSPGAAAAVCSMVIFYSEWRVEIRQIVNYLPLYTGFLGLLMISHIRYQHVGKLLFSVRHHRFRMLVLALILVAVVCWPALSGLILVNGYVLSGPITEMILKLQSRRRQPLPVSS